LRNRCENFLSRKHEEKYFRLFKIQGAGGSPAKKSEAKSEAIDLSPGVKEVMPSSVEVMEVISFSEHASREIPPAFSKPKTEPETSRAANATPENL
jgi:hypothetical protein